MGSRDGAGFLSTDRRALFSLRISDPWGATESASSWKAGREDELGGACLQVAQGLIGEGRERFVIVRLHPAVERDAEREHAHLGPQPRGKFVCASLAQGSSDRLGDPGVLE